MLSEWDERYGAADFAYGKEPNEFLASVADRIPPGPVLCLAEGQGRNAVFLAQSGRVVTAVDRSAVGLMRAHELAKERGVTVKTVQADLAAYIIRPAAWSGIVAIFAHLPQPLRSRIYRSSAAGLAPGGVFILEAYTPAQIAHGTGGPKDAAMLPTLEELKADLSGLELEIARECERAVIEGKHHTGLSAVVQIVARKPKN